jgi:hypothetical protein
MIVNKVKYIEYEDNKIIINDNVLINRHRSIFPKICTRAWIRQICRYMGMDIRE